MSAEYSVEEVRTVVDGLWARVRPSAVHAEYLRRATSMLTAYAERIEANETAVPVNLLSDDEVEWLNYAIAHMHDDSEPEDQTCADVLQRLLDRTHYPPAQAAQLKKVYASLRDGMSEIGDWFDASTTAASTATSEIVTGKKKAAPVEDPAGDAPQFTVQEVHDAIANAESKDKLDEAIDLVNTLPKKEQQSLYDLGKVVTGKFTA